MTCPLRTWVGLALPAFLILPGAALHFLNMVSALRGGGAWRPRGRSLPELGSPFNMS